MGMAVHVKLLPGVGLAICGKSELLIEATNFRELIAELICLYPELGRRFRTRNNNMMSIVRVRINGTNVVFSRYRWKMFNRRIEITPWETICLSDGDEVAFYAAC
jgi:molybdopterin converting factor small subunit